MQFKKKFKVTAAFLTAKSGMQFEVKTIDPSDIRNPWFDVKTEDGWLGCSIKLNAILGSKNFDNVEVEEVKKMEVKTPVAPKKEVKKDTPKKGMGNKKKTTPKKK